MKKLIIIPIFLPLMLACALPLTAADTNLGTMPDNWGYYLEPDSNNTVVFASRINPQITFIDNTVLHNGHNSIRIEAPATIYNAARELDWTGDQEYHIPVSAGDTVVFGCWIKTDASTHGNSYGAIIGFDLYHDNQRLWEVAAGRENQLYIVDEFVYPNSMSWVHSGQDWTYLEYTAVIPNKAFITDDMGIKLNGFNQANYIIPWVTGWWQDPDETASVWFSDAEIYINPTAVASTNAPNTVPITVPVIHTDYSFVAILVTLAAFVGLGVFLYKALFGDLR